MSAHLESPNTEIERPNSPLWRKFAALVYDCLVLAAISMGYGAIALLVQIHLLNKSFEDGELGNLGSAGFLGWALVIFLFYSYFWQRGGQTLGMRAWRLKILTKNNDKPTWSHCLIRAIAAPIGLLCGFLGYLWQLIDTDKLTLHDRLSSTKIIVLPKRKK